jgi:hypothetical protein
VSDRDDKSDDDVAADLANIPRLPRGGGFRFATADLVKIGFTAGILVLVLVIRRPCSESVGNFVSDFDNPPAGSNGSNARAQMPKPDNLDVVAPDPCQVALRGDMTDAERLQAIDRARACAAARKARAGSGSAGSATP